MAAKGETRGLCVVRTWEDERKIRQFGNVSVVWASTSPKVAATPPSKRESGTTRTTTSITWNYQIDEGFTYALTVLATNRDNAALPEVADCSSGDAADSPSEVRTDDFPVSHRVSDPAPYRNYQLCARAENDYGASEWAFIGAAVPTRPSAPGKPSYESGESEVEKEDYGGQKVMRLVWSVAGSDGTPQDSTQYDFKYFGSYERSVSTNRVQATCEDPSELGTATLTSGGNPATSRTNTNNGIEVEVEGTILDATVGPDEYYIYACVRADPDSNENEDHGAWSISTPQKFVAGQSGSERARPGSPGAGGLGHGQCQSHMDLGPSGRRSRIPGAVCRGPQHCSEPRSDGDC